ncbi:MAG: SURF1 family protein [Pseudomonadota bacterium]
MSAKQTSIRRWLVISVSMIATMILLGLSYWQYSKIAPKDAAIALIESRMTLPPTAFPARPEALADWHYRVVSAEGRYIPQYARHIYRAGPSGRPGYHLLVPFARLSAPAIWVDLGWFDRTLKPTFETPALPLDITPMIGQIQPRQRNAKLVTPPSPDIAQNIFYRIQPDVLGQGTDLDALTEIYLISPIAMLEGLEVVPPPVKLEHNHRSYAIQWLAMAVGLVVITIAFLRKR